MTPPQQLSDLRAAGDLMQSSLSRIIEYVTVQTLPYEVRMAVHEGASAIEDWTNVRRADAVATRRSETDGKGAR